MDSSLPNLTYEDCALALSGESSSRPDISNQPGEIEVIQPVRLGQSTSPGYGDAILSPLTSHVNNLHLQVRGNTNLEDVGDKLEDMEHFLKISELTRYFKKWQVKVELLCFSKYR